MTSKRNGPFGEAPVFGTYTNGPFSATLLSWFGYAPVGNVKSAPGATRASASPAAWKPVSARGGRRFVPVTMSMAVSITVTRPLFASSAPSTLTGSSWERNWVTKSVSSRSSSSPSFVTARPRGSGPTFGIVPITVSVAVSITLTLAERAFET